MKTPVARIKISEDTCLYVERVFYVVQGLQALLQTFYADTEFPINKKRLAGLRQEYDEAYAELSITLRKVYRAEVDPAYLDEAYYELEVDFEFHEIQVYAKRKCPKEVTQDDGRVQQSAVRRAPDQSESRGPKSERHGHGSCGTHHQD